MTWRPPSALLVAVCCAAFLAGCQSAPSTHPLDRSAGTPSATRVIAKEWTIDDPRVTESSGLARGQVHPAVIYTHNDRGGPPHVFAVDETGTLAVLRLDVPALDWEDVATTPDGRIWVGDIGDNELVRSSIEVVVIEEPEVLVSADVPSTSYAFDYPDGPHDAEALLVDPRDDRIHIVTKDVDGGRVYRAPRELDAREANPLELVGTAPPNVTGGDFAPDGSMAVLRNQGRAFFYRKLDGPATEVTLPSQPQGESVTFTPDGRHVLVGTETAKSTVFRVRVPLDPRTSQ